MRLALSVPFPRVLVLELHPLGMPSATGIVGGEEAINIDLGSWRGFEAAHIFPLAYLHHWDANNFGSFISIESTDGESINSVQNGLLLESAIHSMFDGCEILINPDVWIPFFS